VREERQAEDRGTGRKDEVVERYERREIDFERMLTELFMRDVGIRVRGER
jgi:hypothetical protein